MANAIITENLNTGSANWQITNGASTQIQAYAGAVSVDPGGSIAFYVSCPAATFTIDIYRLGWYQGLGGRLIQSIGGNTGVDQGNWNEGSQTLTGDAGAISDASTHNFDANWASSYVYSVPGNAVPGYWLAKFTDSNGKQWSCSFIVRGYSGDYCVIHGHMTDAAYNDWGSGYSLYTNPTVGSKVSLNRPIVANYGGGNMVGYELPLIRWLEKSGYNLAYLSDIDVHNNPVLLLPFKAVISPNHDEYWTYEKRGAFEAAIAAGVGVAFLGANCCYWQVRMEAAASNSSNPAANRTVVCYKVQTANSNLSLDPQYAANPARTTTLWRDAALGRPEATMIGIQFIGSVLPGNNAGWTMASSPDARFLAGTGLIASQTYGSDIVGNEWDGIVAATPANYKTIGSTQMTDHNTLQVQQAITGYYIAPSGALVFSSGSIDWTWALDSYRVGASAVPAIPGMQVLMANVMGALKGPVFSMVGV